MKKLTDAHEKKPGRKMKTHITLAEFYATCIYEVYYYLLLEIIGIDYLVALGWSLNASKEQLVAFFLILWVSSFLDLFGMGVP